MSALKKHSNNRKKSPRAEVIREEKPTKLLSVSHYHQRPGCHPGPVYFGGAKQCVELVTGGRGWVEIQGSWKEVVPGDLLWHKSGDNTIGRSDFDDPYRCLAVRFEDWKNWQRPIPRLSRWEDLEEVRLFTHQVVHLYTDDAFDSEILLNYILGRLHFQAELYSHIKKEHGLPLELQQALTIMKHRYAQPIRLAELARSVGWSVPHLHDRFKECLGASPYQVLIRRRIQAARELLAGSNDPIKSVAGQCGFSTATAFCVQFKKHTQLSPKEYRERQHIDVSSQEKRNVLLTGQQRFPMKAL